MSGYIREERAGKFNLFYSISYYSKMKVSVIYSIFTISSSSSMSRNWLPITFCVSLSLNFTYEMFG